MDNRKLNVSIDLRIVVVVLLVAIAGILAVWKPWNAAADSDRTVKVTGEATVKAEPDEYVFYPSYEFKNASKDAALAEVSKKSEEITAKLKALGVADSKIKTNSSGYDRYNYYRNSDDTTTYTLQLTVTVEAKDLAQKVQDYLVSTQPMGSVSPQASFSDAKRKQLESKARDDATKDARGKADQSARNLGFKVGKVKSIEDGTGFNQIFSTGRGASAVALDSGAETASPKLDVQPGENEITYTVTVIYYVR